MKKNQIATISGKVTKDFIDLITENCDQEVDISVGSDGELWMSDGTI